MKKLFFLIFPLAFIIGFMPFFFTDNEQAYSANAPEYDKHDIVKETVLSLDEQEKTIAPHIVKQPEANPAELLKNLNMGIEKNATYIFPNGINYIVLLAK